MFQKKTLEDIQWTGKTALVRVDFNVPLKNGEVGDDTRIRAAVPTIDYLTDQGARVVLCSHLGRPKGKVALEYSLRPVAARLSELLERPVTFSETSIGSEAEAASAALAPGEILLLENTRFHPQEEENDPGFAQDLAQLGDVFVNDAFGSAHRAHASTEGVARILPGVAGYLLEKEIKYLGGVVEDPARPFVAILGGAKISDKIGVIENLLGKVDALLIGGGMANTFLAADGIELGESLVEPEVFEIARELEARAAGQIRLPLDFVAADRFAADAERRTVGVDDLPQGWRVLDIGPQSVDFFKQALVGSKLIVWNGPMGVFEFPNFAKGTIEIARAVAASGATTVVGGGDSVAALNLAGVVDQIDHVSTGGGASLEMLEGTILPGVAALQDR